MEIFRSIFRTGVQHGRTLLVLLILSSVIGCGVNPALVPNKEVMGVGLTGVHHMSSDYNIMKFFVNAYDGGNVGRGGGGGGLVCCVMIPKKWHPGVMVDVRWMVGDWSKEVRSEIDAGNYRSMGSEGIYMASVPLEYYSSPDRVYVHFFPGGRVRVVSSSPGAGSPEHPIVRNDPNAGALAIAGKQIKKFFTDDEEKKLERKYRGGSGWK